MKAGFKLPYCHIMLTVNDIHSSWVSVKMKINEFFIVDKSFPSTLPNSPYAIKPRMEAV